LGRPGGRASSKRATSEARPSIACRSSATSHTSAPDMSTEGGGASESRSHGGPHVEQQLDAPLGQPEWPVWPLCSSPSQSLWLQALASSVVETDSVASTSLGVARAMSVLNAHTCPKTTMASVSRPTRRGFKRDRTRFLSAGSASSLTAVGASDARMMSADRAVKPGAGGMR